MSDRVEEAEFWLPSEFLTDEDILMDNKENLNADFCFPTEFPYDFDSVVNSSDEEDQLAELTRQLSLRRSQNPNKSGWVMAGSPQSTLVQVGSWTGRSPGSSNGGSPNGPSQVSSPPPTPLGANNDAWDLIHQAAGQVARLKVNGGDATLAKNRALLGRQRCPLPPPKSPSAASYYAYVLQMREEQMLRQQQQQRCAMLSNKQVRNGWAYEAAPRQQHMAQARGVSFGPFMEGEDCGKPHAGWPSLQYLQQQNQQRGLVSRAPFPGGGVSGNVGAMKKQCAGTGVFLPRRYGNNNNYASVNDSKPAEYRRKSGCSPALFPARLVQSLNRNFSDTNVGLVQPQCLLRFDGGYAPASEVLGTRRNALLMMQQRRNLRPQGTISPEISLPQEWTY